VWDFQLYVVGLTWDSRNGADTVYNPEAEAQWQFDGTGTITPGLVWTGNATGVSVPSGWLVSNDNMVTAAPRFNDIFKQMGCV
jgi:hypothetical protein